MTKTNEDYYPPAVRRLQTVNTQIEEFETVIFRNDLEKRIAESVGMDVKRIAAETDFNNTTCKEKLDVLYEVKDELQKELGTE